MDAWLGVSDAAGELPPEAARALDQVGFAVIPGPIPDAHLQRLTAAYDDAVRTTSRSEIKIGRTTTRVDGLLSRGADFDALYLYPPLLEACGRVIGGPFKLSALHARTLHPGAGAQDLHVDVRRDSDAWPLVGFILMIDAFRPDNGATRFVPGSHRWRTAPDDAPLGRRADADAQVLACGPAGSLLVFDGSTWHGHSANVSNAPRRSIQGAFIPRDGRGRLARASVVRDAQPIGSPCTICPRSTSVTTLPAA